MKFVYCRYCICTRRDMYETVCVRTPQKVKKFIDRDGCYMGLEKDGGSDDDRRDT